VNVVAVLVPQPKLDFVRRSTLHHVAIDGVRPGPIVGMEQAFPSGHVRLDLCFVISEHLFPPRRVDHGAGVEIPVPDAFLRAGESESHAFFALAQLAEHLSGLAHVSECDLEHTV
jgi:hypothetical protein